MRLLDLRLNALAGLGVGLSDGRLIHLMRRWLAIHEAIGRMLPKMPEAERVAQVRAILASPKPPGATVDRTRRAP